MLDAVQIEERKSFFPRAEARGNRWSQTDERVLEKNDNPVV